jgi:hypothetical protein
MPLALMELGVEADLHMLHLASKTWLVNVLAARKFIIVHSYHEARMPLDFGYLSFYNGSMNLAHLRPDSLQSALHEAIMTPDNSIQIPLFAA